MDKSAQTVFWDIIDCGIREYGQPGPCHGVISSQGASKSGFHVPEPWNGNIDSARILFVSINPGYSPGELYPRTGNPFWLKGCDFDTSKVESFFERRFDLTSPYVEYREGGHAFSIRMEDSSMKKVRGFWTYVFKMADVLIPGADPLKDFVITELVHCKSKDVSFLTEACYDKCMERHFSRIFELSKNMEYAIFIGGSVREHVCRHYGFSAPEKQKWYITTKLNGRETKIAFVDHNNAFPDRNGNRAYGITPVPEIVERIPLAL